MLSIDASQLPRIMACNGSFFMKPDDIPYNFFSDTKEEGIAAHWLASIVNSPNDCKNYINQKASNGIFITDEMSFHVKKYLELIHYRHYEQTSQKEVTTSFDFGNVRINGRADHIGLNMMTAIDSTLSVDDLKYGFTIIEPYKNWTLIAHAVGFRRNNNIDPDSYNFTICQPRASHYDGPIRTWSITRFELDSLERELYDTLNNLKQELHTGQHCYKCPSFVTCPARQMAELNAIEESHIAFNKSISNEHLAERLQTIERAISLLNQTKKIYEEDASYRIAHGQLINGYIREQSFSNRVWKSYVTAELIKVITGIDLSEKGMISPAQAEKIGFPSEYIELFTERISKGSKLTKINVNKKAEKLFGKK